MELALRTQPEERAWRLRLKHPEWGQAELVCDIEPRPIPELIVKLDPRLTGAERAEARMGGTQAILQMDAQAGHVLRDRKRFLRFLRAVMGSDGLVAADAAAQGFWTRASLDEELTRDADLEVTALYSIPAVQGPVGERDNGLHTHGLDKDGGFDFDILEPASGLLSNTSDALRSTAYAILEGDALPDTPAFHLAHAGGMVGFVRAAEFQRRAGLRVTEFRGYRRRAPFTQRARDDARGFERREPQIYPQPGAVAHGSSQPPTQTSPPVALSHRVLARPRSSRVTLCGRPPSRVSPSCVPSGRVVRTRAVTF